MYIVPIETVLHDLVEHYSSIIVVQSTYIKDQKRLGYILFSEDLMGTCNSAGHTAFSHSCISDHRYVYCDVIVSDLFDSNRLLPLQEYDV